MIKAKVLGFSGGIVWGVALFVVSLIGAFSNYATAFTDVIASIYPGYSATVLGAFLGLVYGFIDGFIALFLIAWIYNLIIQRSEKSESIYT